MPHFLFYDLQRWSMAQQIIFVTINHQTAITQWMKNVHGRQLLRAPIKLKTRLQMLRHLGNYVKWMAATRTAHCQSLRFLCLRDARPQTMYAEGKKPGREIIHNSTTSESRRRQFFNGSLSFLCVSFIIEQSRAVFHEAQSAFIRNSLLLQHRGILFPCVYSKISSVTRAAELVRVSSSVLVCANGR